MITNPNLLEMKMMRKSNLSFKDVKVFPDKLKWKFSVETELFHQYLMDHLFPYINGCAIQIRHKGKNIYQYAKGYARKENDGNILWNQDTKMHISSCSKLITAVATVKALQRSAINVNSKILYHLPSYWKYHKDLELENDNKGLTYNHLLKHTSGLTICQDTNRHLTKTRLMVNHPIPYINHHLYENANYVLLRLLLPIYTRTLKRKIQIVNYIDFLGNDILDDTYDKLSKLEFQKYIHQHLLQPSGVPHTLFNSDFSSVTGLSNQQKNNKAYAYQYHDAEEKGWDSGDLSSHSGSIGLRMSVNELLSFLYTLRQTDKILTPAQFNSLIENNWGINTLKLDFGTIYLHNGWWENGNHQVEQSLQIMLPNNYDLVILGNSSCHFKEGKTGHNFENIILDALKFSCKSIAI